MATNENLKSFEIDVNGRHLELEVGRCAVSFIRQELHKSFISAELVDDPEGELLHIFMNVSLAEWMAGYRIAEQDGEIHRPTVRWERDGVQHTFREIHGWNPTVSEYEVSDESIDAAYNELSLSRLEDQFGEGGL